MSQNSAETTLVYSRDATPLVVVSQLAPEQANEDFARQVQALLLGAYSMQFETAPAPLAIGPRVTQPKPALKPNTIKKNLYNPENPLLVARYRQQVRKAIVGGSEYWVGRDIGTGQLISLARLSPSRRRYDVLQQLRVRPPDIFINDIDVEPARQGIRLGTITLLHALDYTEITQDNTRDVGLHAYNDSVKLSRWYVRMGLRQMRARDPLILGSQELSKNEWSTAGSSDLAAVKSYLRSKAHGAQVTAEKPKSPAGA